MDQEINRRNSDDFSEPRNEASKLLNKIIPLEQDIYNIDAELEELNGFKTQILENSKTPGSEELLPKKWHELQGRIDSLEKRKDFLAGQVNPIIVEYNKKVDTHKRQRGILENSLNEHTGYKN